MGVTVEELLDLPFFTRTQKERQRIVLEGKPRPPVVEGKPRTVVRQTNRKILQTLHCGQDLYDILQWITRCDKRRCFFCWPCLLFMTGNQWSEVGVPDSSFVVEDAYDHEKAPEHIKAMLAYRIFIQNHIKPAQVQSEDRRTQHNRTVTKNREILKCLIDAVCNVIMRVQSLSENGEYNHLRKEDCISALEQLRNYDVQFVDLTNEAIYLLNAHPKFVHDLVDAVTGVIKSAFRKETEQSTFVAVIFDEHSEISSRAQISSILRYIKNGKVCERFVGFINKPKSNNTDEIFGVFNKTVSEFHVKEKLVALSLGASMMHTCNVPDLLRKFKAEYPYTFFVPYCSHGLNYILQQSVSHIKECELLFRTLNEIGNYFQKDSKQWIEFEKFMFQKLPHLENAKWYKKSELVKVVDKYRKYFVEYFANAELNCEVLEVDRLKIRGFKIYLENFDTVFLLRFFAKLFEILTFEDTLLKHNHPERSFDYNNMKQLRRNLRLKQETGFISVWMHICINMEKDIANNKIKEDSYRELFNKIMSVIVQEIECRFSYLSILEFCDLQNYNKCNQVSAIQSIKTLAIAQKLCSHEKEVMAEFKELQNSEFARKPMHELLEFLIKAELNAAFPNFSILAEFLLTVPFRKGVRGGPSKLKQVRKWSYISNENVIPGEASILFIEADFLKELKKYESFHEEVILRFIALANYMSLIYQ